MGNKPSGSPIEMTIMDKTAGTSRTFPIKSDEEPNIDLGGLSNEISMAGKGGHTVKTPKPWMIENCSLELSDGSYEFLQGAANSTGDLIFTISFVNGDIYKGTGQITGDLKHNTGSGYTPVTCSGAGSLEKIS